MRREGRQHGFVRTHADAVLLTPTPCDGQSPRIRVPRRPNAPPAAGAFAKVPSKPTNHSKPTGRCRKPLCATCHPQQPAGKSKRHQNSGGAISGFAEEVGFRLSHGGVSATGAVDCVFFEEEGRWDTEEEDSNN